MKQKRKPSYRKDQFNSAAGSAAVVGVKEKSIRLTGFREGIADFWKKRGIDDNRTWRWG